MRQFVGSHVLLFIHGEREIHCDAGNDFQIGAILIALAITRAGSCHVSGALIDIIQRHVNFMFRLKPEVVVHRIVEALHVAECAECEGVPFRLQMKSLHRAQIFGEGECVVLALTFERARCNLNFGIRRREHERIGIALFNQACFSFLLRFLQCGASTKKGRYRDEKE